MFVCILFTLQLCRIHGTWWSDLNERKSGRIENSITLLKCFECLNIACLPRTVHNIVDFDGVIHGVEKNRFRTSVYDYCTCIKTKKKSSYKGMSYIFIVPPAQRSIGIILPTSTNLEIFFSPFRNPVSLECEITESKASLQVSYLRLSPNTFKPPFQNVHIINLSYNPEIRPSQR